MSITSVRHSQPKARKKHICRACEDIKEGMSLSEIADNNSFTDEEKEVLRKAICEDGGMIQVGEVYECQVNSYEGEIYTWRAKIAVYDIADKYGLLRECD